MESANSKKIKKDFEYFSNKNGFNYHKSDSIIAPEDSKLLFNISGGVKYQNELLGLKSSSEEKIASIQQCVRTDSIKSIGYSGRHHLFFEMLGHFMFYTASEKETKEEFIEFAYSFLTKNIGLEKDRLYMTVHPQDEITMNIWKKLGSRNIIQSDSNVFISPYADKSSLRTEIKWQKDDREKSLIELWNLVFTQFDSSNLFENPSKKIAADSGASLERIVSAYENKCNNYDNSMWREYVKYLTTLSDKGTIEEYRRLADYFNTSAQIINEGIIPGNKVQPYVLRKMLRTTFDICEDLDIDYENFISEYFKYNTLNITYLDLLKIVRNEFEKYNLAIKRGVSQAEKLIRKKGADNVDFNYIKSTCGLQEKYITKLLSGEEIVLSKKMRHK